MTNKLTQKERLYLKALYNEEILEMKSYLDVNSHWDKSYINHWMFKLNLFKKLLKNLK